MNSDKIKELKEKLNKGDLFIIERSNLLIELQAREECQKEFQDKTKELIAELTSNWTLTTDNKSIIISLDIMSDIIKKFRGEQ